VNLKTASLAISAFCHPLLLPTGACAYMFYVMPIKPLWVPESMKGYLLLVIFMMTFIAPMLGIVLYYLNGTVKTFMMDSRQDRLMPFVLTTCLYAMATYLFATSQAFSLVPLLAWFIGGITLTLAFITCITFYWKISAHSTGIMGIVGFWFGVAYRYQDTGLLYPIAAMLLLAGVLMSARMYLQAHTPAQILAGGAIGLVVNLCAVLIA